MPRRREVPKREIQPDPKYGDRMVTRFMNIVMLDGKKGTAERILYGAFDEIESNDVERRLSILARWIVDADRLQTDYGVRLPDEEFPPAHGDTQRHRCLIDMLPKPWQSMAHAWQTFRSDIDSAGKPSLKLLICLNRCASGRLLASALPTLFCLLELLEQRSLFLPLPVPLPSPLPLPSLCVGSTTVGDRARSLTISKIFHNFRRSSTIITMIDDRRLSSTIVDKRRRSSTIVDGYRRWPMIVDDRLDR